MVNVLSVSHVCHSSFIEGRSRVWVCFCNESECLLFPKDRVNVIMLYI